MTDVYGGPFAVLTTMVGLMVQTVQDEVIANVNAIKALLPDTPNAGGIGVPMAHPDFDQIPIHTRDKLIAELDALITNVDATPIV